MSNNTASTVIFCAENAQRMGLEEAILWQFLQDAATIMGKAPYALKAEQLCQKFPFWQIHDCQRVAKSLNDQGFIEIQSAPLNQSNELVFNTSLNTTHQSPAQKTAPQKIIRSQSGANRISPKWRPDRSILDRLYQDHGIIETFAQQQVTEFVRFWVDSGKISHSWAAQFYKQVVRNWQRQKAEVHFLEDSAKRATSMQQDWYPHSDAVEILIRNGISKAFIEDAIPEFVLFWREKGAVTETWSSNFIKHVKRQWVIFTGTSKYDTIPKPIASDWQPAPEVYDILQLAHIEEAFAKSCIKEFILYWQESGRLQSSWNTKFLQNVKYLWANQHQLQGNTYAQQQRPAGVGNIQPASFLDKHTDRSWTEGL